MKLAVEVLSEAFAATAAILGFTSARVRLRKPGVAKVGLKTGLDDPKLLLRLIYAEPMECVGRSSCGSCGNFRDC